MDFAQLAIARYTPAERVTVSLTTVHVPAGTVCVPAVKDAPFHVTTSCLLLSNVAKDDFYGEKINKNY